jgi:hypothetical protein
MKVLCDVERIEKCGNESGQWHVSVPNHNEF